MSETQVEKPTAAEQGDDFATQLFAQLVMQQANMALMLMGKVPHPQTGQVTQDIEGARLFIDQLEMLETKTRGNLSSEESALLKQSLMTLRLAFVEAVESSSAGQRGPEPQSAKSAQAAKPDQPSAEPTPAEEQSRKKFSKKY